MLTIVAGASRSRPSRRRLASSLQGPGETPQPLSRSGLTNPDACGICSSSPGLPIAPGNILRRTLALTASLHQPVRVKRLITTMGLLGVMGITAMAEVPVIPRPTKVEEREGVLTLKQELVIRSDGGLGKEQIAELRKASGLKIREAKGNEKADIYAQIYKVTPDEIRGAYYLSVEEHRISIGAGDFVGLNYGFTTLTQLLEAAKRTPDGIELGHLTISDSPRFAWRGYMLDESRHFSGEAAVKRLLDAMARFKLNRLHWHLTDSAGWRIEIKKYPKLTSIGGRGNETDRWKTHRFSSTRRRKSSASSPTRRLVTSPSSRRSTCQATRMRRCWPTPSTTAAG